MLILISCHLWVHYSNKSHMLLSGTCWRFHSNPFYYSHRHRWHNAFRICKKETWEGLVWYSQASSGGFAYFMWGIDVLGLRDLSADLTIVLNDKCIDSSGTCFVPTLTVTVQPWWQMGVSLTTKSNKWGSFQLSIRFIHGKYLSM